MASETCTARPESSLTLTFTQGLIVGQISVVLLVVAFIKFFIFGDTPSPEVTASTRATERRARTLAHKQSIQSIRESRQQSAGPPQPTLRKQKSAILRGRPLAAQASIASILSKTYYTVDSHQPESLDWFNVLIAQTIAQFRSDAQHDDAILTSLAKALNSPTGPDFLDEIRVTELSLGEDFPIFSNCRIIPVDEDGIEIKPHDRERGGGFNNANRHGARRAGRHLHPQDDPAAYLNAAGPGARLQARMDVDLSDMITLALETKLVLNFPQPRTAVLPVALAVSVVRFSGTLRISFIPSNPSAATPTMMTFSFLDDYRLDLSIRSLVGSRSRLQDVPKIAQLIESRLHRWFDERAVEPRFQEIALPSLWPRKKNTRGPDSVAGDIGGGGVGSTAPSAAGGVGDAASVNSSLGQGEGKDVARDLREADGLDMGSGTRPIDIGGSQNLRLRRRLGDDDEFSMPGSLPST